MKLFITFLSLRFFDMRRERDTQFLSMLTFPSDPTTWGTPLKTTGLFSASSENRLPSSSIKSQLTVFFKFQNPQPKQQVGIYTHLYVLSWASNQSLSREWTQPHVCNHHNLNSYQPYLKQYHDYLCITLTLNFELGNSGKRILVYDI